MTIARTSETHLPRPWWRQHVGDLRTDAGISHVHRSLLLGAHIGTMPYAVMQELPKHELTDAGLKKFQEDWEKVQK